MRKKWGVLAATSAALAAASAASAGITEPTTLLLQDHPGTVHSPPSYGLRLDNIFGALGGPTGFTTFSFNEFDNVFLTVEGDTLTIAGTVYGGLDEGADWGFGEGAYALNFVYNQNVAPLGTGWVAAASPMNEGTLTALGDNAGVPMGTVFELFDIDNPEGRSLEVLQDGHRLTPEQILEMNNPWVGRGWMNVPDGGAGTRDWIFVAVPGPGSALSALIGLAALARRRR